MPALESPLLTLFSRPSTTLYDAPDAYDMLAPSDGAKLTVMFLILITSLVAVSFPAISNAGVLRLPDILFFIGKHLGTGVILSTAFIHLLPDSFDALLSRAVKDRYGNIGKWTGLIILSSLLAIFLVEYVSTTYVDRLYSKPSAPSSPEGTPSIYAAPLPIPMTTSPTLLQEPSVLLPFLANSPKIMRLRSNTVCICHSPVCVCPQAPNPPPHEEPQEEHHHEHHDHHHHHHESKHHVGRRRQIVGILVLQVGIMIHSLVIGLTLSVTSGADFTSLTSAILFHQLFEGLSLGVRIAALPHGKRDDEEHQDGSTLNPSLTTTATTVEGSEIPALDLDDPSPSDGNASLSTPLLLKVPSRDSIRGSPRAQLPPQQKLDWRGWDSLRHHHEGYGSISGLDHGHHRRHESSRPGLSPLKVTLSLLFAVTTPIGMAIGMAVLKQRDHSDKAPLKLIQGVMSAVSAGMLIYAATVEMIAGDFVFGDVEGGHHHGHGHGHHPNEEQQGGEGHQASLAKKALAVISLLLGVVAMVLIGLKEGNH